MTWRSKKFGPKITRAHWRLHFGLVAEGIPHFLNYTLNGRTRCWNVDVYVPPRLVVEVDGSSHYGAQLLKDEIKTVDLEQAELPFTVLRFRDAEVFRNLPGVLSAIKKLYEATGHTPIQV